MRIVSEEWPQSETIQVDQGDSHYTNECVNAVVKYYIGEERTWLSKGQIMNSYKKFHYHKQIGYLAKIPQNTGCLDVKGTTVAREHHGDMWPDVCVTFSHTTIEELLGVVLSLAAIRPHLGALNATRVWSSSSWLPRETDLRKCPHVLQLWPPRRVIGEHRRVKRCSHAKQGLKRRRNLRETTVRPAARTVFSNYTTSDWAVAATLLSSAQQSRQYPLQGKQQETSGRNTCEDSNHTSGESVQTKGADINATVTFLPAPYVRALRRRGRKPNGSCHNKSRVRLAHNNASSGSQISVKHCIQC
jgi:hypothetical protein